MPLFIPVRQGERARIARVRVGAAAGWKGSSPSHLASRLLIPPGSRHKRRCDKLNLHSSPGPVSQAWRVQRLKSTRITQAERIHVPSSLDWAPHHRQCQDRVLGAELTVLDTCLQQWQASTSLQALISPPTGLNLPVGLHHPWMDVSLSSFENPSVYPICHSFRSGV